MDYQHTKEEEDAINLTPREFLLKYPTIPNAEYISIKRSAQEKIKNVLVSDYYEKIIRLRTSPELVNYHLSNIRTKAESGMDIIKAYEEEVSHITTT